MPVQPFRFSTTATTQVDAQISDNAAASYPERYIFLVLALVIIVKILRILRRHRMEHEFDEYLSRTSEASNNDPMNTSPLPGYAPLPTDISSIVMRPTDDPYHYAAGGSNLSAGGSEVLPPPAYREVARKSTRQDAALPPPPYAQVKSLPPPPEPLDLPHPGSERYT
ncbi:hypothetical protein D9619_011205 [Psilocybe cf. subviscida]|uniref:Uncharacterized protein n=1 Tax=Psilocybe cf. subviscida TaxID=2480587 RepID=A0A8H5BL17_9AGAR|nr:hypothetical protein D9619_011205 [Psilocybe cf. subviscida]